MTVLAAFLGELSDTHKAITALIGATAVGATLALGLVGFTALPKRVTVVEGGLVAVQSAVEELDRHVTESDEQFARLVCLLTIEDRETMTQEDLIRECGL